jgi:hypothetical protein
VACGENGISSFDRIRYRHYDAVVFLYAFDLIELDGNDLRRDPLAVRKATLASLFSRASPGLRFNEHLTLGRVSDDISSEDRGEPIGRAHISGSPAFRRPSRNRSRSATRANGRTRRSSFAVSPGIRCSN